MNRLALLALPLFALSGPGCGDISSATPVSLNATPSSVKDPKAPGEEKSAADDDKGKAKKGESGSKADAPDSKDKEVTLVEIKFDDLKTRIAANKKAKLTMVDVWSTTCPPCIENFPHVVEMHAKYAAKGLAVVSLDMDEPDEPKAIAKGKEFLRSKKATFANYRLDSPNDAYEKLEFNTLPAVFLYTPDGKVFKRFTWDDPNNQFTYEQVEKAVDDYLNKAK